MIKSINTLLTPNTLVRRKEKIMTALEKLQMEQKLQELENKLGEAAECIYHLTEMVEKQQKQIEELQYRATTDIPHNTVFESIVEVRKYLAVLGYTNVSEYIFLNDEKTIRANVVLTDNFSDWEIKFSRV